MHFSTICLSALALSPCLVSAFPTAMVEEMTKRGKSERDCPYHKMKRQAEEQQEKRAIGFNAKAQLIDVSGKHAFTAPGRNDIRGPCPGLNALANHNYISHKGVDSAANIIAGVNKIFGMGVDLGTLLAVYGTVMDGNPLSLTPGYSIDGPAPSTDLIAGVATGFLGVPQGLSGSHNKYEGDASPTRGDLYLTGNNYELRLDLFEQEFKYLSAKPTEDAIATYQKLLPFRKARMQHSISNNPYFFYNVFSGVAASPATYSFQTSMMANHSAEYVNGYYTQELFKTFFGVSGSGPGKFSVKQGWERIPNNWYRRAIGNEYTLPLYIGDVLSFGLQNPQFILPGGNTGKVNTFTPVNITALTKGVFNAATLLQGNNLACFIYQFLPQATPDLLKQTVTSSVNVLASLTAQVTKLLQGLNCPQLQAIDKSQFNKYPGYKKSAPN